MPARVLNHDVPCRNCFKSVCPQGHHDCLRHVEPEAVAARPSCSSWPGERSLACGALDAVALAHPSNVASRRSAVIRSLPR